MTTNSDCSLENKKEELVARGGSIVEEEKIDDGRGVRRKTSRKKEVMSCGGQRQCRRNRRLQY